MVFGKWFPILIIYSKTILRDSCTNNYPLCYDTICHCLHSQRNYMLYVILKVTRKIMLHQVTTMVQQHLIVNAANGCGMNSSEVC